LSHDTIIAAVFGDAGKRLPAGHAFQQPLRLLAARFMELRSEEVR
jgi:hypothetical protein